MFYVASDYTTIETEIDRIASMPNRKMTTLLNEYWEFQFAQTQEEVHVISGALKASGKQSTEANRETSKWIGEISYGGNGVNYAAIEQDRHGDHDFMSNVHLTEFLAEDSIREGLS